MTRDINYIKRAVLNSVVGGDGKAGFVPDESRRTTATLEPPMSAKLTAMLAKEMKNKDPQSRNSTALNDLYGESPRNPQFRVIVNSKGQNFRRIRNEIFRPFFRISKWNTIINTCFAITNSSISTNSTTTNAIDFDEPCQRYCRRIKNPFG